MSYPLDHQDRSVYAGRNSRVVSKRYLSPVVLGHTQAQYYCRGWVCRLLIRFTIIMLGFFIRKGLWSNSGVKRLLE